MDVFTPITIAVLKVVGWGWSLAFLGMLAFSESVNGALFAAMIAALIGLIASLRRLVMMMIKFGEVVARYKIKTWAKEHDISDEDIKGIINE